MKPIGSIPVPVLRAREIHRQVRIPKISAVLDLGAVPHDLKSRLTFQKMRVGFERRMRG